MQARERELVSPFLVPRPPPLPFWLSLHPPTTGIDVNQIPPQELDLPPFFAPPPRESCPPPLSWPAAVKRERGKTPESSSRGSEEEDSGRKKLRLSKEQSALLEESFQGQSTLNPKQKKALAKKLSLTPRQVEVWFQNRRARTKLKQTEFDCEYLKRCCDSLTQENRRLQKEVQELRAIKVAPPCAIGQKYYTHVPTTSLTMCPSCQRVATMDNLSVGLPRQQQSSAAC